MATIFYIHDNAQYPRPTPSIVKYVMLTCCREPPPPLPLGGLFELVYTLIKLV